MMEYRISDMLDGMQEGAVQIKEHYHASTEHIQALTLDKIEEEEKPQPYRPRNRRLLVVLAAVLIMTLATTVLATTDIFPEPTEPTFGTPAPFEVTTYEYDSPTILSGSLEFTVTGARAVIHKDDMPEKGSFAQYDNYLYLGKGWPQSMTYPQYVTEDGSFMDGAFVILVDMTVTNKDAVTPWGPGVVRLNNFLYLSETKINRTWKIAYYSENDRCRTILELAPGESKQVTIGFQVGDNWDGSTRDLSKLALAFQLDASHRYKIPLGLCNYDLLPENEEDAT